ncbi:cytochrome P450 [Streptomyces sp. NPDC090119]|uniref:cytochrome P450 n=1 Tax=Streptomyces sp. NPDC090119 TaxID=3365951 RepID=UPI0038161D02
MDEETPWQQALRYANRADPYPFYEELRKTPVTREPDGSYVVGTYWEVVQLLHDPRVSSDPTKCPRLSWIAGGEGETTADEFSTPDIISSDPPEHDRFRRLMTRHFYGPPDAPDWIARTEPDIHRIVDDLLDKLRDKPRFDAVDDFAYPLPVSLICQILGVPLEDEPLFHAWIESALDSLDFGPEAKSEEVLGRQQAGDAAYADIHRYMSGLIDRYAREPGPGMLSAMVHDDSASGPMPRDAIISNALLLLFAGHETTVNLIAHSLLTLLRHPEALAELRARPELIVPGVEEMLRLESSVQFWFTRSALEDIDIAGTTIPKGSPIFLVYGSANRDPNRFPDPEQVDLERPDNEHLGYSQGIHFCFGAPLARLEVQVAVQEFIRRVENPRLVTDPPPYRHNQVFRGPRHVLMDADGVRG